MVLSISLFFLHSRLLLLYDCVMHTETLSNKNNNKNNNTNWTKHKLFILRLVSVFKIMYQLLLFQIYFHNSMALPVTCIKELLFCFYNLFISFGFFLRIYYHWRSFCSYENTMKKKKNFITKFSLFCFLCCHFFFFSFSYLFNFNSIFLIRWVCVQIYYDVVWERVELNDEKKWKHTHNI